MNDERFEPTDEDLYAIATWSYAAAERQYQEQLLDHAMVEEKFANWTLGLGYKLDVEV